MSHKIVIILDVETSSDNEADALAVGRYIADTILRNYTGDDSVYELPESYQPEPMTYGVAVFGPNLPDQSNGTFHVHMVGCKDCGKLPADTRDDIQAQSIREIVEWVYADMIAGNPDSTWEEYATDFYFAPCTKDIPNEA